MDARRHTSIGALILASALALAAQDRAVRDAPRKGALPAEELRELLALVPDEALFVAIAADPPGVVDAVAGAVGSVPPGLPADVVAGIGAGLTVAQIALQGSVAEWAARTMPGGVAVAIVPGPSGPLALAVSRPVDPDATLRWFATHARAVHVAVEGALLLASNRPEGLALMRERAGGAGGGWARFDFDFDFGGDGVGLQGAIDLAGTREVLGERWPRIERLDGAGRVLLAPMLEALTRARWLRFGLSAARGLRLSARADAGPDPDGFGRLVARGAAGRDVAPLPDGGLALLTIDRSLRTLLGDPESFLSEQGILGVQGLLSIAEVLDGPRSSFVDDLLGGLEEPFALHALPAGLPADEPVAPLLLPGLALSAPVAEVGVEQVLFRVTQLFALIANVERMQRNQMPFLVRQRREENARCLVGLPGSWRGPGLPPIDRQLTPTVWCGDDRAVLASTFDTARRIATAGRSMHVCGDLLVLRGPAVAAAIERNRTMFELARMLDEGEDRADAGRVVDIVCALSRAVAEVQIACEFGDRSTTWRIQLERAR
jgi:hypothetical protein